MNKQIEKIAKQAGINLTPAQFSGVREDEIDEFTLEKFVELIVEDVLEIMSNPINYNSCVYTTFDAGIAGAVAGQLAKKIKEHFKDVE